VKEHPINADGYHRRGGGKAFNNTYPGPLIEACWGDSVEITVINELDYNGTAIHWHGVRMLNAFEYDGVNAITQCPIAPKDQFTYKFNVTQYGTSWYHSHYSAQYPDGLAGPLTFHGPTSADFDEAMEPFMFSDWSHNSAFEDFSSEIRGKPPFLQSNILNGAGYFNCTKANMTEADGCGEPPPIFTKVFQRGRKYLLKLINASTASTFVFSIDKHILQVVEADFVPIEPYYADSILIGIGQRYHVIVEAHPSNDLIPVEDQNYWIRTVGADRCSDIEQPNPLIGIIRYNAGSTKTPTSKAYQFSTVCADEPLESLVPVVPWTISSGPKPANNSKSHTFRLTCCRTAKSFFSRIWQRRQLCCWPGPPAATG
jgi:FtsP/CotA-like multicopper oxidase with cupredoxin domain